MGAAMLKLCEHELVKAAQKQQIKPVPPTMLQQQAIGRARVGDTRRCICGAPANHYGQQPCGH